MIYPVRWRDLVFGRVLSRPRTVAADFQREAARMHQTLHATHYFSIRKLRLSKSLPPFGRRVAVRSIAPKPANVDYCARPPYKFRSLQGALSVAG